jgi:hypothetical protein
MLTLSGQPEAQVCPCGLKEAAGRPTMHLDWEAANQFVLVSIGLFGVVFYFALLHAGFMEFVSRVSKLRGSKARSRKRVPSHRPRATKVRETERG